MHCGVKQDRDGSIVDTCECPFRIVKWAWAKPPPPWWMFWKSGELVATVKYGVIEHSVYCKNPAFQLD